MVRIMVICEIYTNLNVFHGERVHKSGVAGFHPIGRFPAFKEEVQNPRSAR
jgi:hypothetical protein